MKLLVALRSWEEADIPGLPGLANNIQIARNLRDRFPHPYTASDASDWVGFARNNPHFLAIAVKEAGAEEEEEGAQGAVRILREGQRIAVTRGSADNHARASDGWRTVGGCSCSQHSDEERVGCEIGYWLAESVWGKGVGTEAVALLIEYAWDTFKGVVRIEAPIFKRNVGSKRVLEKNGFEVEGILRKAYIDREGSIEDAMILSLIKG